MLAECRASAVRVFGVLGCTNYSMGMERFRGGRWRVRGRENDRRLTRRWEEEEAVFLCFLQKPNKISFPRLFF